MRPYLDVDDQITVRPPITAVAFLSHPQIYSIIDSLWYVDRLFGVCMHRSFASASHARAANNGSHAITVSANLLNHEWTLPNSLEALTTAPSARRCRGAWLCPRSLTSSAHVSASEAHNLLRAIYSLKELDVDVENNVLTLCLNLLTSRPLLSAEHALEFLKDVTEGLTSATSPSLVELV